MSENPLTERILPLIAAAAPLKMKVFARQRKGNYYIHFDGSATYKNNDDWNKYWLSFENYVKHLLRSGKFKTDSITMKSDTYAVAFVGNFFDFIRNLDPEDLEK